MEIKNKSNSAYSLSPARGSESNSPETKGKGNISSAEKQLQDVAALYEKQFLREMVKQMRSTVSESEFMPSGFAEKYYREQLDQQYVESWGDQGGIGLGKMIYDQLLDRYGTQLGIAVPKQKPRGPLPLGQRDQWTGDIQEKNKAIHFQRTAQADGKPSTLEAPWDGEWLGSYKLDSGLQVARIQHDGVQSTLVGDFSATDRAPGQTLKAGESIGILAPQAKSLLWRLE
jgi:flagellar protein FlgJ